MLQVDQTSGKTATSHGFHKAFGTRWAKRIMPAVLKTLMRHKNIQTTLRYYVGLEAEDVAGVLWKTYGKAEKGSALGNTRQELPYFPR